MVLEFRRTCLVVRCFICCSFSFLFVFSGVRLGCWYGSLLLNDETSSGLDIFIKRLGTVGPLNTQTPGAVSIRQKLIFLSGKALCQVAPLNELNGLNKLNR